MPTAASITDDVRGLLAWAPPWLAALFVFAAALAAALAVHELLVRLVRRALSRKDEFWRSLVVRTRRPGRMAMVLLALVAAVPVAPLRAETAALVRHGLLIGFILLFGWMTMTAVDIAAAL